jgi:hypothetical protein
MREPAWIKPVEMLSAIVCVSSLAFAYWGFGQGFDIHNKIKVAQVIVLCFWILAPPMWFALERDAKSALLEDDREFERFKYTQDLASKIWLALVTVLLILYFGKDLASHAAQAAK